MSQPLAASLRAEMTEEIGYELPEEISSYAEIDPELFQAYREFRSVLLDQGTLSRKTRLLMAIAILASDKQGDAMDMYASIARQEGATPVEIREALRVGILFAGGPGIAASASVAAKYAAD